MRVGICGAPGKGVNCNALAWAMKHIDNKCVVKGRAAGDYGFVDEGTVASMYGRYA